MPGDEEFVDETITDSCTDNCEDDEQVRAAIESRRNLELAIQKQNNVWGYSSFGVEAKKAAMSMLSTKHGMYARIPLTCKGDGCPYSESCALLPYNLAPVGEPCAVETAQIEVRYMGYEKDFDLNSSASFTDQNLVASIINQDIMMERCKALMAKEQIPVIEVTTGISESGEEFTHPEVSKFFEVYDRAEKKRNDLYQLMMATRKDKKNMGEQQVGIHDIIAKVVDVDNNGGFIEEERPDQFKDEEVK